MKVKNLCTGAVAIFCLTSCTQQTKELSLLPAVSTPPASIVPAASVNTAPSISSSSHATSKDKSSANSKVNVSTTTNSKVTTDTLGGAVVKNADNAQLLSELAHKLLEYKLDKLANNFIICSVNDIPISLGDYRREFKIEQQEVQASLTYNAQLANGLLQAAHKQGIALTPPERENLLKSTGKMQLGGKKGFDKMLAESHMNKKQFDEQVLDMGLACKMANIVMESNLLNQLVNHLLLSQVAKNDGFSKEALNKYAEMERSGEYKKLLATGAFSADDLRSEIISSELCAKEAEKIKKEAPLTDVELNDFYEKNRGKFRHGERIRLSQIFIAPDKPIKDPIDHRNSAKYKLAQSCLERACHGEDFAALADQYSEDSMKKKKDGGDLGLQEEAQLTGNFVAKIAKLAPGTVIPELTESPHGYHIFKLTGKENPGLLPF